MGSLLPLLFLSTVSSSHATHYINPTTPTTSCPTDPCSTLSEYGQQLLHNLTSNTKLLLLPGNHVLSANFTVENVSGFEILSSAPTDSHATRIVCQGFVGFSFRNISHVTMCGLTMSSCGKDAFINSYITTYGVSVYSVLYTSITDCSFQDNVGTALGVFHSRLDLRGSNNFTSNCRSCGDYTCLCFGGGIYARMSTLTITGNNTFRVNSASKGGVIAAEYSALNFTGIIAFENNSAEFGGGIYAQRSTLNFNGSSIFGNNSAAHSGGGIYIENNSTLNFSGNSSFGNNSAGFYGGGILAANKVLMNFNGNSIFRNTILSLQAGGFVLC